MKVAISKVPERHQVQGLPNLGADRSLKKAGKSKKKKKKTEITVVINTTFSKKEKESVFKTVTRGAPGWLRRLSVQLRLRS